MRSLFAILISLGWLQAAAADEARQEIRFCPADVAHTYPLDSRGRVQSLLAPHIALINHAADPFTVKAVHVELLNGRQVVDARPACVPKAQSQASQSR